MFGQALSRCRAFEYFFPQRNVESVDRDGRRNIRANRVVQASPIVADNGWVEPADFPRCALQALTAALILSIGSSLGGPLLFLFGLPLTLAGFVLACCAARNWSNPARSSTVPAIATWLAVMAALGIVGPRTGGLLWYEIVKRSFAVVSIGLVGVFACEDRTWQRRASLVMIVLALFVFALGPIGAPHPTIDVFAWTQASVQALLHRIHPYTVVAPDVYQGRYDFGFTVSVYPYMPATLIAYAPWVALLGDFRFVLPACLALTIALVYRIGRRLQVNALFIDASALAFVLHPSGPRMIESGWAEPLMVVAAALFVSCALDNPRGVGQATAFLLLPALKQYVVAPPLLYLLRGQKAFRLRALAAAAAIVASTLLPFLIWNWHATISGMVFQMQAPTGPRLGSTSLVALVATTAGVYPSRWMSAIVQLIVGAIAWWRLKDHGLSGFLLASALSLYATFLVGWQAFVNYYYFVGALLILAALVRAHPEPA